MKRFYLFTAVLLMLLFTFFSNSWVGGDKTKELEDLTFQAGGSFTVIGEASAEEKKPPAAVNNKPDFETWIDYAAKGFDGGTGTEKDPYRIATAEQLAFLAKTVNEGNPYKGCSFRLVNSIDLSGKEWVPIGINTNLKQISLLFRTDRLVFSGFFDGKGHAIKNLTMWHFSPEAGLFGALHLARVENLQMQQVNIAVGFDSGGLAAKITDSNISLCSVTGRIAGMRNAGGIAGIMILGKVVNCRTRATIKLQENWELWDEIFKSNRAEDLWSNLKLCAGGIAGDVLWGSIMQCEVFVRIDGFTYGGGISGRNNESKSVGNCASGFINGKPFREEEAQ